MIIVYITLFVLLSVTILFFLLGFVCFLHSFVRNKRKRSAANGIINTEKYGQYEQVMKEYLSAYASEKKESVYISSFDSLSLHATLLNSKKETNKLVIAFHGYRSCGAADFSAVYKAWLDNGYSALIVDQRSHGQSEGKYIGFGVLERQDALAWCEYATKRFGTDSEIYLCGVSMGAATVTLASSLPLPKTVKGIVADCGFSSPYDIIVNTLRHRNKIPPYPTVHFINFWTRLLARYDFKSISSVEEIKKSDIPILLIHGSEDRYVPTEMSKKIYAARKNSSRLLIVDGARHARSMLVANKLYIKAMLDFFADPS